MPDVRSGNTIEGVIWPGSNPGPKPARVGPYIQRTSCSSVGAFAVCPQLHGFGYDLGLRTGIEKDATKIGSLVHVGLAYRYASLMPVKPVWLVYPDPRYALWICGQDRPDLATEALRIFDAYERHHSVQQWRPILVEHQFHVDLPIDGTIEKYTLRIDLLAEDVFTGELVLIDHKTTSKMSKYIGRNYRTDREMLTGLALCRANGYDVKRVVINAMTKEQPEPRFGRFDVPISEAAYSRIGTETIYWIQQMRNVERNFPDATNRPRNYNACLRTYGLCDFDDVCANGQERLASYVSKWAKKKTP